MLNNRAIRHRGASALKNHIRAEIIVRAGKHVRPEPGNFLATIA